MIRLKFKKEKDVDSWHVSNLIAQDGKILSATIHLEPNPNKTNYRCFIREFNSPYDLIIWHEYNVESSKIQMKLELQKLGVHFDKEVRNRKLKDLAQEYMEENQELMEDLSKLD